ncbi:MAG: beta-ketoacyl-ACP synthase II [Oscillospiraceae bacterium]|nr:beta-ketoacyl-ACP synthase II [Oscillospiraceae bacterium]
MDQPKLVITGMGAVTPVGIGVEPFWKNLIDGRCGVGPITRFDASGLPVRIAAEVDMFDPANYLPKSLMRNSDPFMQYAYIAAAESLGADGLPALPDRMGIVMGTSMSGISTIAQTQEELTKLSRKQVGPRFIPKVLGNVAAANIAIQKGIQGPSLTVSTACSSGADAIITAAMLLMMGEADAVVAVGAESILCPLVIYSLSNARALSRRNEDPLGASRPFDKDRDGFVIGEGGGAVVLETEEHAKARGAKILAELIGWGNNSDAHHVTEPREDGSLAAVCMEKALRRAKITPEQVDYINAHGTGTKLGDKAEASALHTVFGAHIPPVSSTKGATGHMMGAGGITEAIACILAMRDSVLPPTLNLETPDPDCPLDCVAGTARQQEVNICMTNAFGFGGQNSSLLLKKPSAASN